MVITVVVITVAVITAVVTTTIQTTAPTILITTMVMDVQGIVIPDVSEMKENLPVKLSAKLFVKQPEKMQNKIAAAAEIIPSPLFLC